MIFKVDAYQLCEKHQRWLAVDKDGRLLGKCDECAREYAERLAVLREHEA